MGKEELSDEELLALIRNAETGSYGFNLLVRKYQERVYHHIRRMVIDHNDADDLMQDTFISVWKGLLKFRGDSGLYTWIYRIATNEVLAYFRKKKRFLLVPIGKVEHRLRESLHADPNLRGDSIQMKLQEAILTLPEKQRLVFNLRYFDEMKYSEMSKVLGTSEGALKASYHHAVKKIEVYLKTR